MPLWQLPSDLLPLSRGEVHLWRFPLEVSAAEFFLMKNLLSSDELRRADRLLDCRKAQAFVVGRGRLRQLLGSYLQCDSARIVFDYGVHGKPALNQSLASGLSFNLSHAGDWGILALTTAAAVGIDIEKIDPELDFEGVAAKFFKVAENAVLAAVAGPRRRRAFYRLWTEKEARLKGEGEGFSITDERLALSWQTQRFWVAPGYVGAIACNERIDSWQRWQDVGGCQLKKGRQIS